MTTTGCIFCGGTPLTREHFWPNWLRRELDISQAIPFRIEQEYLGVETRDVRFQAPPFDQQVRAVCAVCNNGWMAAIEEAAKPILLPLVQAEGRRLHRAQQRALATWVVLKACVFDEVHPLERAVPTAHRQYLFAHRVPPAEGVWVRLATYEARDLAHYAYQGIRLGRQAGEPPPSEPTVYFVTLTVGALVTQLSGSLVPEWSFADVPYPAEFGLAAIWPTSASVEFAQRNVMTHETLLSFTKLLYNVVGRLSGGVPPAR